MVNLWVKKIEMGLGTLEDCPDRYYNQVKTILDAKQK